VRQSNPLHPTCLIHSYSFSVVPNLRLPKISTPYHSWHRKSVKAKSLQMVVRQRYFPTQCRFNRVLRLGDLVTKVESYCGAGCLGGCRWEACESDCGKVRLSLSDHRCIPDKNEALWVSSSLIEEHIPNLGPDGLQTWHAQASNMVTHHSQF
jgi:hypothetical protein